MKFILFLLFSLSCTLFFAQNQERVLVQGEIYVPKGDDPDQISVYNVSSEKGTVTDNGGTFKIEVAENDRVMISALQFQTFTVVIDAGVVNKKIMRIYLNPAINQLDEIVVSPYDLSGNINVDVKRVNVYESPNWDLSYETLEYEYEFTQDRLSKIEGNVAEDALQSGSLKNGFNFVSVFGLLANSIFKKKEKQKIAEAPNYKLIITALQQRFSPQYYHETFGIPLDRIDDFLFFAEENAVTAELLKIENELELMEVLFEQSTLYKAQIKDE